MGAVFVNWQPNINCCVSGNENNAVMLPLIQYITLCLGSQVHFSYLLKDILYLSSIKKHSNQTEHRKIECKNQICVFIKTHTQSTSENSGYKNLYLRNR